MLCRYPALHTKAMKSVAVTVLRCCGVAVLLPRRATICEFFDRLLLRQSLSLHLFGIVRLRVVTNYLFHPLVPGRISVSAKSKSQKNTAVERRPTCCDIRTASLSAVCALRASVNCAGLLADIGYWFPG